MDSRRAQQGTRQTPARYQSITDDAMLNEGGDDDVWPVRLPSSTRRYQRPADVQTGTGHAADVQTQIGRRDPARPNSERHTIPPRRTATQGRIPALPTRITYDEDEQTKRASQTRLPAKTRQALQSSQRRPHWLFFTGLAMLVMILGWVALSAVISWWQTTLDDWHYGRPRTYQIDAVVGHHDSVQNPSHFIAMNLNRHIVIIEIPGGDVSKSIVYSGPTLLGPGQDLTPVTLRFQDLNHDGTPDMIATVQNSQFVFLNEHGTFVPSTQNIGST